MRVVTLIRCKRDSRIYDAAILNENKKAFAKSVDIGTDADLPRPAVEIGAQLSGRV
jgi:hypothetical protein